MNKNLKMKEQKAITLIALVITIIVLLILSGITILTLTGENGILGKSKKASNETDKQTASEKLNLKITNIQMDTYIEKQQMPNLKELSLSLKTDDEIEYITETSKVAEVEYHVPSENPDAIYTKLNEYPYEFEIDKNLRLASINGVKVAESESTQEIDALKKIVENLQAELQELKQEKKKDINYTLNTEREIGVWYDGTPMYELSLEVILPSTSSDGTSKQTDINLQNYNINECVISDGFFVNPQNNNVLSLPVWPGASTPSPGAIVNFLKDTKNLRIHNAVKQYNGAKGYITLRYNKDR